jgi:hypothetical protein
MDKVQENSFTIKNIRKNKKRDNFTYYEAIIRNLETLTMFHGFHGVTVTHY